MFFAAPVGDASKQQSLSDFSPTWRVKDVLPAVSDEHDSLMQILGL